MRESIRKLLEIATNEVGYLEKRTNMNLDNKNDNAGANNFTKYARDLYPSLQGQAWCDMFVDWCFVKAFGKVLTGQMIGGFSAYTPTSADYYRKKGRLFKKPEVGDQIFFKNDVRINHTGIVVNVDEKKVYTIEGNTSAGTEIVPNGGAVCKKSYELNNPKIAGYGRPDWALAEEKTVYKKGWNKDKNGWWYADTEKSYLKNCWQVINSKKYYFNQDGYAVKDWNVIDGNWYYFEPRSGAEFECALYTTDASGIQKVGSF